MALPPGDPELQALCESFVQDLKADTGLPPRPGTACASVVTVVDGGASRAESVRAAMAALLPDTEAVLVHDAARALTPESVFHRVVHALCAGADAVIPVMPVVDTVKTVEPTTGDGAAIAPELVTGTAPRETLRAVQTPQGFDLATLRRAHEAAAGFDAGQAAAVTDDAMLVELLGILLASFCCLALMTLPLTSALTAVAADTIKAEAYTVGPGDTLQVVVFGDENVSNILSGRFKIEPDGSIHYPLLGSVPVTGRSTLEIAKMLHTELAHQVQVPATNCRGSRVRTGIPSGRCQPNRPISVPA